MKMLSAHRLAAIQRLSRHRALAADTAVVLLVQLLSRGMLNLVTVLAANKLSVANFSGYNYYLVTVTLLGSLTGMGLPVSATRAAALAGSIDRQTYEDRAAAVVWTFVLVALLAAVTGPFVLDHLRAGGIRSDAGLLTLGAFAFALCGISQSALQGAGAFRSTLIPVLAGSCALLLGVLVAWVRHSETPLIVGTILFYLLPALAYLVWLGRHHFLDRAILRRPSRAAWLDMASIALPSLGNALIFTGVSWWLARTLLAHAATPTSFPEFVIGMQWFSLALFVPLGLGQAIFPRYLRMAAGGTLTRASILQPAIGSFLLVVAVALAGMLCTPFLSLIYGAHYDFSTLFVGAMLLAAALSAPANILGQSVIAAYGAGAWLRIYLLYLVIGAGVPLLFPPSTPLEAALILCGANLATASGALATMLLRLGRRAATTEQTA
jgi:O-antigen/teichoic acid export membrane protein